MPEEKYFQFGEHLLINNKDECQFIHYDNKEKTKATIDINGMWEHHSVLSLSTNPKYSIDPIPTLPPEYIAFVEWTIPAAYEEVISYRDNGTWRLEIDGEYYIKTTQQLFDYFIEKVYKK